MSLETSLEKNRQTEPTPTSSPLPPAQRESERNRIIHSTVGLCSLALAGCFFLPWIRLFLGTPSGYDLQQLPSDEAKLLWLIPVTALIALVSAVTRKSVITAAQIAGAMPYLALIYYCVKLGGDLLQALQIGAYLSLMLGAILFVAPRFLEKPTP